MPYYRKKQTRRPRKYSKRPAKRYSRKPRVSAVKTMVRKEIARNVENKTFQYVENPGLDILPCNSPGFESKIISCSPNSGYLAIQQGTGQGQRIGNRIKIKSLRIGGVIFPLPYNATSNLTPAPVQIKLWFFYDKEEPQAYPTPQSSADFLQFGSSSLPLQNQLFDHSMPVNTDRYRVLTTRTYKLGYASYLGTGTQPQQGNFSNNDFKLNCNFNIDLTKHSIKNVLFRDNSSNPTSRGIFMMAQAVYANGTPIASNQIPARMSYMLTVDYEDA